MKQEREGEIVRASVIGVVMNVLLVGFKIFVGLVANSISVIMDAVNNLADTFSQLITIVGTKLSAKKPDKKHPYGYGRIEYLTSAIVASLVMITGITSAKESVMSIIHPEVADYSVVALVIIGVAVLVKLGYGIYTRRVGKKVSSDALLATATDSIMDSVLSLSTFVTALISKFFGLNLESYVALVLSAFIIKAGVELLRETIGDLIGGRVDSEISQKIKAKIRSYPEVNGAYDLILHDYGPSRSIGSVHIEIPADMSADKIHLLSRRIIADVMEEFGIILTVGVYANKTDELTLKRCEQIREVAKRHEHFMQMHGFFVDEENKVMLFDTLISYKAPVPYQVALDIQKEVGEMFPGYTVHVNCDHDFSD